MGRASSFVRRFGAAGFQEHDNMALAPNGLSARATLAAITSAGILYANVSPLIVSGLALDNRFTQASAGYLLSINMYGTAFGGFVILFLIRRISWRPSTAALLLTLICCDTASVYLDAPGALFGVRFVHGLTGGALIGVLSSVIARMASPERTIAFAIVIQLVLGGAGAAWLAPLMATVGVRAIWFSLIVYSAFGLALLPLLDRYQTPARSRATTSSGRAPWLVVALACAGVFVYQAGEMASFAYIFEIGMRHALDTAVIGRAIGIGLWVGGPAALLVAWWSTRSGRMLPASFGAVATAFGVALLWVPAALAYFAANIGLSVCFSLTLPYLLGVVAEMDNDGDMAAIGGFVNSLGLATGPAIAATIIGDAHYERVVVFAVTALLVSGLLVAWPARVLDRRNKRGRVVW
jgi:predicted MFS family arabinose efflux permease